ncbi:MAG: class I SAM-dependent methyltransferase [Hyphomicrobiaceae bacterium]
MNKSLVQQQFGANAANYVGSTVHAKGASLAGLVEAVQPEAHWSCIDVATGAGHTAIAFAPHVSHILATDLTEEMLDQVRRQVKDKGLGNVDTAHADAEALPFGDGTFDLVTCRIAPHHFGDIPKFVSEAFRVLKSGGTFALVDNIAPDALTTPGFAEEDLVEAAQRYNALEKRRDPSHGRAWTAGEWRQCIEANGFAITHEERLDKAMSFKAWCKNQSVPADLVPQLATMLKTATDAFAAYIRPEPKDEDIGFTIVELLSVARKP